MIAKVIILIRFGFTFVIITILANAACFHHQFRHKSLFLNENTIQHVRFGLTIVISADSCVVLKTAACRCNFGEPM